MNNISKPDLISKIDLLTRIKWALTPYENGLTYDRDTIEKNMDVGM
jgi:hypothetical protein